MNAPEPTAGEDPPGAALPFRYLQSRTEQGILVLTITRPELFCDQQTIAVGQELLTAVDQARARQVVLDLEPVEFLTSEGLRMLLQFRRRLRERGGQMLLCNVVPLVAEVLFTAQLADGTPSAKIPFAMTPDVAAAVTFLTGSPSPL